MRREERRPCGLTIPGSSAFRGTSLPEQPHEARAALQESLGNLANDR